MNKEVRSFKNAFIGILKCIIKERHFRFELACAIYVIFFAACFYNLSNIEWCLLVITIALVLICEAFNTAIERVCDLVTTEYNKTIKLVKDISAGAVLLSAIMSIVIAFLILFDLEVFKNIINYFTQNILLLLLLVIAVAITIALVAIKPKEENDNEQ